MSKPHSSTPVVTVLWVASLCAGARAQPLQERGPLCEPSWIPTFGEDPGTTGDVASLTVLDDGLGGGPALYVGGSFITAGSTLASRVARWDGGAWSAVGTGMNHQVRAVLSFDDGTGAELIAGGLFSTAGGAPANRIARWDGSAWSPLGAGLNGDVLCLAAFDDGSGTALYAGGAFVLSGAAPMNYLGRFDGASWAQLDTGLNGIVRAVCVFDDGTGSALYAGGDFTTAGGAPANRIARWDGTSWSTLGAGLNSNARALSVFDDGTGLALYVGGQFTSAGGVPANRVARWDGTTWSALGGGVNDTVRALAVHDDGAGAALHVGGLFTTAGGAPAGRLARWDGSSWAAPFAGGLDEPVWALLPFDDGAGRGPALFAGGLFQTAGGLTTSTIARWDGASWGSLGEGLSWQANALATFDSGAGPELIAGGAFTAAQGAPARRIARFDGTSWAELGGGFDMAVRALTLFDEGAGDALFAGGDFTQAGPGGTVAASRVARWDGTSWSALAGGLDGPVHALATFDDGTGEALYAGGAFTASPGGASASAIARWDGSAWSPLASGIQFFTGGGVRALCAFDDGTGPALFVGGIFGTAGGAPALFIARWDGTAWSDVGGGRNGAVLALATFDDGSGPALFVGGEFTLRIARWNGTSWTTPGSGMDLLVSALGSYDDGTGPALFAGGSFRFAGGVLTGGTARWDGAQWSALGSQGEGPQIVYAFAVHDDGDGPALIAAGGFSVSPAKDSYVARYRGCAAPPAVPYCFGDGTGVACPCGNAGAPGHGCDNAQGTGGVELTVASFAPNFAGGGTADFVGAGYPASGTPGVVLIRGPTAQAPATIFGDGLLCVAPAGLVRIQATLAAGGASLNPVMHGAGAGTYHYQLWLRNTPVMFCDPAAGFNLSNGVALNWP